jgi:threonine/homoserine/homoserine lactone efflux protein
VSIEAWLSLALLCLFGAMTPGPSLAVVLGSSLRGGHPAGLAAALAHGLAVGLYAVLTVAGLAALLTASLKLFALLQFAAAGYLVYLARSALRRQAPITTAETDARRHQNLGAAAGDGFMIGGRVRAAPGDLGDVGGNPHNDRCGLHCRRRRS